MLQRITLIAAAVSLSACVQYSEVTTPPQAVSFTTVTAQAAATGVRQTTVRTTTSDINGDNESEVLGAACDLDGTGFNANFTSPAIIQLPTFSGAADAVTVRCTAEDVTKAQVVNPLNLTLDRIKNARDNSSVASILIGAAVRGIATAARDPLKDEYAYPQTATVRFGSSIQ